MYIVRVMGTNGLYIYSHEKALMKRVRAATRFEDRAEAEAERDKLNDINTKNPNWEVVTEEQAKADATQ